MKTIHCLVIALCASFLAACNTTDKASKGDAGYKAPGVKIEGKIEGGKGTGSGSSGTKPNLNPQPDNGGAANPGGAAVDEDAQATPPAAANECYKGDAEICKIEAEILRLTNEERAKGGPFGRKKGPLKAAPKLSWLARDWSAVQARRGSIGHDGFPNQRSRKFSEEFSGARADISAENVAMTGYGQDVAREFFDMWKNSPGHYANMMGDYAAMGIGVARVGNGWYATEIFGDE